MTKKSITLTLIIGQIFLWTGSAFISVLYRLLDYYEPLQVTLFTEVLYYLMQALGIALFALFFKVKPSIAGKRAVAAAAIGATIVLTCAALLVKNGVAIMYLGLAMNSCIGALSGIFLTRLSSDMPQQCRVRVFGFSYAIGSIGTWLLSLLCGGKFLESDSAIYVFIGMAALSILLTRYLEPIVNTAALSDIKKVCLDKKLLILAFMIPFLCSVVNGMGYYFSAADVSEVLNPAFTRIFYAVGLVGAGIINDKNRRYGAVCCITALIFPFVSLALRDEIGISAVLCVFSYIFYGFFSVYRVVLFADMAGKSPNLLYLAVFGMLSGRIGDALGTYGGIALADKQSVLICGAALVFVICSVLFFSLYHRLYVPILSEKENTEALLTAYEQGHGFTQRQCEIFRLVVKGRSNGEIAAELYLSESTVKFHMKNILKITANTNRTELIADYLSKNKM